MNDSVLDILIFLFDNYMDVEEAPAPDRDVLRHALDDAGFTAPAIDRALVWLDGLTGDSPLPEISEAAAQAIRVFSGHEQVRLDTDVRGYILHLEQEGILSSRQREHVIDRLLALDAEEIDIEQVKWVVLMVLFSQPGQEEAYARMEGLVFDERPDAVH
jgi:Smg protein